MVHNSQENKRWPLSNLITQSIDLNSDTQLIQFYEDFKI